MFLNPIGPPRESTRFEESAKTPMNVIRSEHRNFVFDAAIAPALEVELATTVVFETDDDTWERLASGTQPDEIQAFNPVTGPLFVRGARPGDALRIEILEINLHRAWSVWMPGFGLLGDRTTRVWAAETPIENHHVRLSPDRTVPLEPMIGCIGLAPASGIASTVRPVYRSGGNLDLREMSSGATLWLPVEVEGALLSLGDFHAAMGHGEPTFVSLEASGEATVRVDVDGELGLSTPRLRLGTDTICVGMGATHEEAKQDAVDQAFALLTEETGFSPFLAYAYMSARVGLRFAGPAGTRVEGLQAVLAVVPDPE